jgi:hypothetical protein
MHKNYSDTTIWRIAAYIQVSDWFTESLPIIDKVPIECRIEFGLWPVAPGHRAGVVWTCDDWVTTNLAEGHWSANVSGNVGAYNEYWIVELNYYARWTARLWYALYVDDFTGTRHWDNNQGWNYETSLLE